MELIKFVQKRDGSIVPFDKRFITNAILEAFKHSNEGNATLAKETTESVVESILQSFPNDDIPTIEQIQDVVENTLIQYNFKETVKKYIHHRRNREALRV